MEHTCLTALTCGYLKSLLWIALHCSIQDFFQHVSSPFKFLFDHKWTPRVLAEARKIVVNHLNGYSPFTWISKPGMSHWGLGIWMRQCWMSFEDVEIRCRLRRKLKRVGCCRTGQDCSCKLGNWGSKPWTDVVALQGRKLQWGSWSGYSKDCIFVWIK